MDQRKFDIRALTIAEVNRKLIVVASGTNAFNKATSR